MAIEPKYPHNILEGYGTGALLDLRVRLAINFLQHSPMVQEVTRATLANLPAGKVGEAPMWVAKFALEVADELLKEGAARGYVSPLPDPEDTTITAQDRAQAVRTARYSVLQQMAGAKVAQEEGAGQIIPVAPIVGGRKPS